MFNAGAENLYSALSGYQVEMSGAIVQIDNVSKQYKGSQLPAISHLNLQISRGSVFGLLGPNGAGKSTLVMLLCGLLKPDEGIIQVMNLKVGTDSVAIREKIGVAPQEIALFPTLTAYENLYYFGRMYGLETDVLKKRIMEYVKTFGLQDKMHKRIHTFSGGMKRRLNLIAALLHDPTLIILDEPTSGVDVQSRNMILEFLLGLKSKGVTMLYTSHFLEEAERICTHLAIVDEGKLLLTGTPEALLNTNPDCKNLEELFLKRTGKNIRD